VINLFFVFGILISLILLIFKLKLIYAVKPEDQFFLFRFPAKLLLLIILERLKAF